MYQGQGYGGWSPWGSNGGMNANQQGQAQSQQHGINQGRTGQMGGQMQQFQQQQQQQQQQGGAMGYGGMGTGSNNMMMGMMGYPGGMTNNNMIGMGMGMTGNSNNAPNSMMGMTGTNAHLINMSGNSNNAPNSMMGMTGTNAHLINMSGTPGNSSLLGMGMNMGNQFAGNPYANQQVQTAFGQQQQHPSLQIQQQNSSQSLYQTNTSFSRPQPPLPPGPPPVDQPSRDLSKIPLFNNVVPQTQAQPPTPVPPPPLPKEPILTKSSKPPPPPRETRNQPNIPAHVLKLLKSAEDARILETAENSPKVTALMSLNVSQDLFGTPSNFGQEAKIPGLDFSDNDHNRNVDDQDIPDRVERVDFETMESRSGDRKLDQKPSSEWNQFNRNNRTWRDNRQNEGQNQTQNENEKFSKIQDKLEEKPIEIVWELRSEIKNLSTDPDISISKDNFFNKSNEKQLVLPKVDAVNHTKTKSEEIPAKNLALDDNSTSHVAAQPDVTSSNNDKPISSAVSEAESGEAGTVAATIPLGSGDGKPVEYDRKTLKAFDRKFREWEFQFENWKKSNDNHPDKDAYKKYMDQWNLWRHQLIEQRRFILDSMNKARMEGTESALRKRIAKSDQVGGVEDSKPTSDLSNEVVEPEPETTAASKRQQEPTTLPRPPVSNIPTNTISSSPFSNPLLSAHDDPNSNQRGTSTVNKLLDDGAAGLNNKRGQPPPLMSVSVNPDDSNIKSVDNLTTSNTKSDRRVERIPRDRDRPDISSKLGVEIPFEKKNLDHLGGSGRDDRDRIIRDPRDQQNDPFKIGDKNVNPWTSSNKVDRNPFNVTQNQQNPFQVSSQNQFAWSEKPSSENNLPKLSDFLQNDNFSASSQVPRNSSSQNLNYFVASNSAAGINRFSAELSNDRVIREPGMSRNQRGFLEGVTFEQNSRGMPLLTATKSQPIEDNQENDLSQWFTRDRRGGFEDNEPPEETMNDYDDAPAVIDYGHGSGALNEEEEYDIPRGERPTLREPERYSEYQDEEDDLPNDVVTIDYGHGSMPPHVGSSHGYPVEDDYYEDYRGNYEDFQHSNPSSMRGRGGYHEGRGRGIRAQPNFRPDFGGPQVQVMRPRGIIDNERPRRMDPGIPRGIDSQLRNTNRPFPNAGIGRGGPTRYPVPDSAVQGGYMERNFQKLHTQPRSLDEPETERVESPEIMILTPPREPRKAPPRENLDERRRTDRIPRDSSGGGRETSREQDSRSRRVDRSRSRDREDPYQYRKDIPRDSEERSRSEKRSRRDDSPPIRRDRDIKDRSGRNRRLSRSRSRSPAFDRVPIYRNAPGAITATSGSKNVGLNSSTNPPPPRYQTVLIEDILNQPGRMKRPPQIVIILRGLPGSGKTHVAKLIKDREVEMGGSAPRIISLDDYFMAETEKIVKDPLTNTEVKETVMEYEYEPDLEPKYRNDLVRTFKKNVENTYFPFIIVDCVNDQAKHFEHMATFATQKRFQVYIAEVEESVENCVKRNIHHRSKEQIQKIHRNWERTPSNLVKLDIRTLLQDEAVQDVEMEDVSDTENVEEVTVEKKAEPKNAWEDDEQNNDEAQSAFLVQSKWDKLEPSEEKLNRLDGLARKRSTGDDDKVDSLSVSIDSWLQSHLPEDYSSRQQTRPGQKRVRWADIEERRAQERMRDVGFVVGHTDWNRMTDPSFGSSALTKTKYI